MIIPRPARKRSPAALALVVVGLAVAADPARAVTFIVSDTTDAVDANPGDGSCSTAAGACTLRAAVQETNAQSGADTIRLPAATFTLTLAGTGEDACLTGDLDVLDDLTIVGAGPGATILDGAGLDRIFEHRGSMFVISDLTLRGGNAGSAASGGAIRGILGELSVRNCTIATCTAGSGGAIRTSGTTPVSVIGSIFEDNVASVSRGGGLSIDGATDLYVTGCLIRRNSTSAFGGGVFCETGGLVTSVTIADCEFSENTGPGGGGLRIDAAIVLMSNTLVDRNAGCGIVLDMDTPATLTNVAIVGNDGGGILLFDGATLDFRGGTVDGNTATLSGGGIYSRHPFRNSPGLRLDDVTVSNNQAGQDGGGIYWEADSVGNDVAWLTNCTISGNSAAGSGGGISAHQGFFTGPSYLRNCTITDNTAPTGAGIHAPNAFRPGPLVLANTILAGNIGAPGTECSGEFESAGYNIWGDPSGCTITGQIALDVIGVNPMLRPLQDNGGPAFTHFPLPGSPAIDRGDPSGCVHADGSALLIDERGMPRPVDADGDTIPRCDIGAVEIDCGPDADGDTLGDNCDCSPADPSLRAIPAEVQLDVTRPLASTDAVLAWTDRSTQAGSGTAYDVASDLLSVLWSVRGAIGPCIATGLPTPTLIDARPVVDDGFYYLVRAWNACGPPTGDGWGVDSLGQPRRTCP